MTLVNADKGEEMAIEVTETVKVRRCCVSAPGQSHDRACIWNSSDEGNRDPHEFTSVAPPESTGKVIREGWRYKFDDEEEWRLAWDKDEIPMVIRYGNLPREPKLRGTMEPVALVRPTPPESENSES